ncbi:MAG: hypothetical protein Q4P06_02385 [Actinomycetaceae bacterium]|nr:hypothetical protein [Actinomycetaceae bacterium]
MTTMFSAARPPINPDSSPRRRRFREPLRRLATLLGIAAVAAMFLAGCTEEEAVDYKPVIYVYAPAPTQVSVSLDYAGEVTSVYPLTALDSPQWQVTTRADGRIEVDGKAINYLFWEGVRDKPYDQSEGFVVAGEDAVTFLEEKLSYLGLSDAEAADFITFWAPRMQQNPYNLVSFVTEQYRSAAKLTVTPQPQTELTVFMVVKSLDEPVEIPAQQLPAGPQREGLTVVEWGGTEQ